MSQGYRSLEALLHDAFWEAEDDGSEVRLMDSFLAERPGPALEIGAGSGRLMFPLLEAGREIEGLELSPDMLRLARDRAERQGLSPALHQGDMTDWKPARSYASLLAPAFTLQLAPDPAATLRHWRSWLDPGGGLYLTIFLPLAELEGELPENEWYDDHEARLPDGRRARVRTRHRIDRKTHTLHREHRYRIDGGRPEAHESRQTLRWMEPAELPELLAGCGFRLERWFPDFDPDAAGWNPADRDFDGIVTCHALATEEKR